MKFKSTPLTHESTGRNSGVLTIPRLIWNSWLDGGFNAVDLYYEDDKLVIIPKKEMV